MLRETVSGNPLFREASMSPGKRPAREPKPVGLVVRGKGHSFMILARKQPSCLKQDAHYNLLFLS